VVTATAVVGWIARARSSCTGLRVRTRRSAKRERQRHLPLQRRDDNAVI